MARILEISSYPPPHAGWAIRVQHVRERLLRDGHECVVLNIGESRRVPSPEYETVESGWVYVRKVWRYARRGYLVHMHANGESPKGFVLALLGLGIARLVRAPSVLTFHAGVDQLYFPRSKAPRVAPVLRLMFRWSSRIICNSEAVGARIAEYGIPASRIVAIPAFSSQYMQFQVVDLPPDIEAFLSRYDAVIFSYLAMRPVYYPEVLLEAFRRVRASRPGVGLLLCGLTGHGDSAVESAVRPLLDSPDLRGHVLTVGDQTHDQFLTAMSRSRLYVRTHVSDGVCSSVLEALTLGVPVVASENGTRPPGVHTYPAPDAVALGAVILEQLSQEGRAQETRRDAVEDTVAVEANLLVAGHSPAGTEPSGR